MTTNEPFDADLEAMLERFSKLSPEQVEAFRARASKAMEKEARLVATQLLGELLTQIRGIAGDAIAAGHVSTMGRGHFSQESACKAIYALADSAHNIPDALTRKDGEFLLGTAVEDIQLVGKQIFGERSRF